MELNTINKTGTWSETADRINSNFSKISIEVEEIKQNGGGGSGGGGGDVTNADHATSAYTLDKNTPVLDWFLSALNDDDAQGIINFLKGLKIAGNLINRIVKQGDKDVTYTDEDVMSALRVMTEIENSAEKLKEIFLRKDVADSTKYLLSLLGGVLIKKYAKFGDFVTGVSGGYIDEKGDMEMGSGVFRKRLFVPEIAYNRTTYFKGRMVNSPGGGCSVLSYVDNGDGTYTITPDLTDADGLSQFVDDILTTYFVTKNSEGKLNGFEEMKFRVTAADYTAKKFTVIPRPGHSDWKPAEQMVLAQTGNFTDPERQTYILIDSVNGNNCITFFDNANTWDPEPAQMPAWFGKKKGMTVAGINADNYSAVLQNIIMTGLIFQVDEITGQTVRVPLYKGEWTAGKYAYYNQVSHNGALWLCVDDNGTTTEPSETNSAWLKQVSEGKKGDPGLSIVGGGHWESANIPYAKNSTVSFAGGSYLSKVQTSNPPLPLLRVRGGSYLRKKDGGYILSGKRSDKAVNSDWQEMTSGVEPSASYWLDSPVSTINFTSTGTPSPSAFDVTMKQNIGGNVSDTNRFYLVARKYNGSWLAHVGATLSNRISVPATAGYTQFAVRAYKSASDANAWNNNFVAEKGVGVAKDGAIGATGATGAFPRDRGVWASGQTYVWNADYRDKVIYLIGGVYYNFLVKNYGASVTSAPTSANGDSNWEAMQKFVNIATDTLFADGANVAGFMFKNNVLKSHNDEGETLLINGVTGYFKCKNAEITGTITSTKGNIGGFTISSASLEAVSGNNAMLLSANLVRFTGSYSSVFIGADTFPSSSGGAILCPSRISVNRNITNTAYGNVGMYFDIQGSHAYDDNDFQYTGNHALYIVKGDICGFRLRLRRISKSTTLSVMDSVIMAVTSGITLTVPSTAEDGQFYWIRNVSGGDVTIAGTNLVGWNSGEVSTSIGLAKSKAAAMYYDKHNNKWFMNWIDCWN